MDKAKFLTGATGELVAISRPEPDWRRETAG
jgi:hypothetical protein